MKARAMVDVTALLPEVRTPTLVLHARDDHVTPISQGRLLATAVDGLAGRGGG